MNWLDIIIIVALIFPAFVGLKMGIIKAALSLVGLIIGVVLAGNFYEPISKIFGFISNQDVANILAFILILVAVMAVTAVLVRFLKFGVRVVMLGWVDHVGGALFGFLSGFILLSAILATWVKFFGSGLVTDSFLGKVMLDYFPLILGLLPGEFDAIRDFFQQ